MPSASELADLDAEGFGFILWDGPQINRPGSRPGTSVGADKETRRTTRPGTVAVHAPASIVGVIDDQTRPPVADPLRQAATQAVFPAGPG
jgi:hypothetical protein